MRRSKIRHRFRFPPLQTALDGPIHDAVDFIPTQMKLFGDRLLTGHLQPIDRQPFKQCGESATRLCTHLHYCQRTTASENWFLRPAGYDLETDRKRDKWLNGKALNRTAREADQIHYCQLGKMASV